MKQTKSWEDQLSVIYTDMTGIKVDFGKQKETEKHIKSEKRNHKKFIKENSSIKLIDKTKSTNVDRPGYGPREVCRITTATLPLDFKINPKRLDAPCEMCINEQCTYSFGRR